MKVNLIKTESGSLKGWDIIPENEDEKLILGSMRNAIFFGFDETHIEYAGIKTENNYVIQLSYRRRKYKDEPI